MADITLKLIWYRLGETYSDAYEKCEHFLEWYEDFSWSRVDILDMLFLGWLLAAFVVVGVINIYLRFFGHPKKAITSQNGDVISPRDGETAQWLNSYISWIHKHYLGTPEFVDAWIRALNEQTRKHVGEYEIKVDRVQEAGPLPRITNIAVDSSTQHCIVLKVSIECKDGVLLVSAIQKSATNVRVTNCDVAILQLAGQLKVQSQLNKEEIQVNVCFATAPQLRLQVRPKQIDSQVSIQTVEEVIKNAICSSVTSLAVPTKGGYPQYIGGVKAGSLMQPQETKIQRQAAHSLSTFADEVTTEPLLRTETIQTGSTTPSLGIKYPLASERRSVSPAKTDIAKYESLKREQISASTPTGSLQNRRLLVKVIKANGLGDKDFACTGPYCTVYLDDPRQINTTSMVKNTVNPFWDEHFIFDLTDDSTEVKFEVFDKDKPPGIDFLGRAVIPMGELKRMPSSRQIIPLTGKPGATTTSGSVTVEFLFMEIESQDLASQDAAARQLQHQPETSASPRRRIETNRTVMPGGMVVTSKTTLTEKPRDHRMELGYTDSPSRVEKSETSSNYTGDLSSYSSSGRSSHLGAHEAGLTASQAELTNGTSSPPDSLTEHVLKNLSREREMRENPYSGAASRAAEKRPSRTPSKASVTTLTITATQQQPRTPDDRALDDTGTSDHLIPAPGGPKKADVKKTKSFADTLKKKFQRKPKSGRSQSVDRASSMKERSLLRPPDQSSRYSESDYESDQIPEAGLQKNRNRSRSFSSSLKKLFKSKKKEVKDGAAPVASRESSVSRHSTRSATGALVVGREGEGTAGAYGEDHSYSTSVPVRASPLYDQYNSH